MNVEMQSEQSIDNLISYSFTLSLRKKGIFTLVRWKLSISDPKETALKLGDLCDRPIPPHVI